MPEKAFKSHRANGLLITFPNGNTLSTIWGPGSYSGNHDLFPSPANWEKRLDSNTVEILPESQDAELIKRIFKHFEQTPDNTVIGWVTLDKWLWVVNQLAKGSTK